MVRLIREIKSFAKIFDFYFTCKHVRRLKSEMKKISRYEVL